MLARQLAIGFGIAIIFPMLIHFGVATFHPVPKLQSFVTVRLAPSPSAPTEERKEYAEQRKQAEDAYAEAARQFARTLVIVAAPLGIAAILIGSYLPFLAVGTGLILGGIFSVGWGYWSYWGYLDDWIRFVSLLVGFAVLLFVGVKRTSTSRKSPETTGLASIR